MLLLLPKPKDLIEAAGVIYNFALGFSSWHVAVLNTILLPKVLRPHWLIRTRNDGSTDWPAIALH